MKRALKITAIAAASILLIFCLYLGFGSYRLSKTELNVLQLYGSSDKETIEKNIPVKTCYVDYQKEQSTQLYADGFDGVLLTCAGDEAAYYGFASSDGVNYILKLDTDLNVIQKLEFNRAAVRLFAVPGGVTVLTLNTEGTAYSLFRVNFEAYEIVETLSDITLEDYVLAIDVICNTVMYDDGNGTLYAVIDGKSLTTINTADRFLCLKDEKTALLFKLSFCISDTGFGRIYEYELETGKSSYVRFCYINTTRHCALSPDGKYLLTYEIVRWDMTYRPVVIDLTSLAECKMGTCGEDFDDVAWLAPQFFQKLKEKQ